MSENASAVSTPGSESLARPTRRTVRELLSDCFGGLYVSLRQLPHFRFYTFAAMTLCIVSVGWLARRPAHFVPTFGVSRATEIDNALQAAATNALGQREGTIIVMDPQTGRVRAVANQQVAFEDSFAPGSTIKPFVALAALRAGLIDKDSRTLCREHYSRKDFATVCAHPRGLPPLDVTEAIAFSCNFYFGSLGERLDEELLSDTLSSFGFGKPTDINADHESAGQLLRGRRDPRNTLGEGEHIQATPIQLLTAYAALVNGGRLLKPRVTHADDFRISPRAQLEISSAQRSLIIEGMRGAVRYGTAASAKLMSQQMDLFGKTGTATPRRGFRTFGWFVGFASDSPTDAVPAPEQIEIAVLVLINRSHGADAAAVARPVFEEYERCRNEDAETRRRGDAVTETSGQNQSAGTITPSPRLSFSVSPTLPSRVRVHLVSENQTRELSFEDYVLGVVAAEGSIENEPEALKALAVAARTYAAKNAGRHAREGFDFCTITHCQRFILPNVNQSSVRPVVLEAVKQTAGQVLLDEKGQLVDAYFSASCGGMTANLQSLWGVTAPPYLQGVSDEYCSTMPHHEWTDVISSTQLLKALRSDPRTDVGPHLDNVQITNRDATGRAESITLDGARQRTVSGWDFKIIVGRALGWNKLKSSRFEIEHLGSDFIFHGSGFGHGLGLCQEGAHVMAQSGSGYALILGKYFPGTTVRGVGPTARESAQGSSPTVREGLAETGPTVSSGDKPSLTVGLLPKQRVFADLLWSQPQQSEKRSSPTAGSRRRDYLASEHFRISYPHGTDQLTLGDALKTLESTRADLLDRIAAAKLRIDQFPALEVFVNRTTGDFVGRTGQPSWAAAATRGNHIELQPIELLQRRGTLVTTLRHELIHAAIESLSRGKVPRWLAEGTALYFAGEGPSLSRYAPKEKMSVDEIEAKLARTGSAIEMRAAYANAYAAVRDLIQREGEASLWRKIASG